MVDMGMGPVGGAGLWDGYGTKCRHGTVAREDGP